MNLTSRSRCSVAAIFKCNLLSQNIRTFIPSSTSSILPELCKLKSPFHHHHHQVRPVQVQHKYFSLNHNKVLFGANHTPPPTLRDQLDERFGTGIEDADGNRRCRRTGRLIVYEGRLKKQIFMVKFMSLCTSTLGLGLQPMLFSKISESSLLTCIFVGGAVEFFTFVTPILLYFLCRRYVTTMYHLETEDKYVAVTYSLFGKLLEFEFTPEEVVRPEIPGPLTTIIVKKEKEARPLFLAPNNYADPFHYKRLMGWDQPVNLRLNEDVDAALDAIVAKRAEKKNRIRL